MGKKRVIKQSEAEILKEREMVEGEVKKESGAESRRVTEGRIYISASYNNTMLTLTDSRGNLLAWTSAGKIGFKGSKKSTPFAASKVGEALVLAARKIGIEKVAIFIKGVGSGRDAALRSLAVRGLDIISIKDITPIPHNGCRPPKVRRV